MITVCVALASRPLAAQAQAPHAIPPPARPLHERSALAEVIALARVTRVEAGRIAVERRAALRGVPPAAFEVKFSPLRPPALAVGGRALLLLRGARPPYVLVDEPQEILVFHTDADEAALRDALPALLAVERDLPAAACVYSSWQTQAPLLALLAAQGSAGLERSQPAVVDISECKPGFR